MDELRDWVNSLDDDTIAILKEYIQKERYQERPPVVLEIPYKFPSLNEYTQACRTNAYKGANMKRKVQKDIGYFINTLPQFNNPIIIDFTWIEGNGRRDPDNIAFAKKFVLDALVECEKIKDDNRKVVTAFRDKIVWTKENEWKVILKIYEV